MLKLLGIIIDKNMSSFTLLLILLVGFILIIFGGNYFVEASVWLSKTAKIPPVIIGATIVSVGTTLPEALVSIFAAIEGNSAIALGNASGSMLFNGTVILGILLLFTQNKIKGNKIKLLFLSLSCILLISLAAFDKKLGIVDAIILLIIFVLFISYNILEAKKNPLLIEAELNETTKKKNPFIMVLIFILSAVAIAFGAGFLVDSSSAIALKINISEQVVALTVVAIGTSLPELVTAIMCIKKKNTEISIGNIIGANILNAAFICGMSSLISPNSILSGTEFPRFLFAIIISLFVALFMFFIGEKRLNRIRGASFITVYCIYLVYLIYSVL